MATNPKMQENKPKNARKQAHSKIQFYIGIHVTKVEKNISLKSLCPSDHVTLTTIFDNWEAHTIPKMKLIGSRRVALVN